MLYGTIGIVFGILYADYQRAKAYWKRVSKTSFLARGGIALSSLYLLSFFGQKILLDNPLVSFVLGYIDGGRRAKELMQQVDYDGAITAGTCIAISFGVLAFNGYREQQRLKQETQSSKELEVLWATGKPSSP